MLVNPTGAAVAFREREARRVFQILEGFSSDEACQPLERSRLRMHFGPGLEEENLFPGFRREASDLLAVRAIKWHGPAGRGTDKTQKAKYRLP